MPERTIDSLLKERRRFNPPADFAKRSHVAGEAAASKLRRLAAKSPEKFWELAARDLQWAKPWKRALVWKPPFAQWFVGGKLNLTANCLDRHLDGPRRNKAAILWEGEPGDRRTLTYQELHYEVCRFANALKSIGVEKGDRVAIYMPMVPEAAVAMLACARIGATHSVVFGGFSSDALRDRILDAEAKVVVTADGGYRKGAVVPLKENVDKAVAQTPCVQKVVVLRRAGNKVDWNVSRDVWWADLVHGRSAVCPAEALDAEHPLFILYTSGTTGKPKGVVHTTGGYLTQVAWTTKHVFDLREEDTFWCTADVGWVTGHSYVVYGPLANGATTVMYEGAPLYPHADRFWGLVERLRVTIFYTAPTAIRTFVRYGEEWPKKHDLSSL
ncbi:MAG: AMP-binding protein, partial [Elusimicrobia bacterium]|nr:AMP-binding protein [Elusimicrobiota bacterium]